MNALKFSVILLFCVFALSAPATSAVAKQKATLAGAAPNQRVDAGARVELMGSGWSTAGRVVRFAWTQVGEPRVRLRNANRSTASFIAPNVTRTTVLKFRLTVTDTRGGSDSGIMTVTVEPKRKPGTTAKPPN
jgi:chitinase